MYISHLILYNFKSFKGKNEFDFKSGKNFLVGNNNVGKTTIFEAIDFLFNGHKRTESEEDLINNENLNNDMYVEVTFSDLSDSIKQITKLRRFITNKNTLSLMRGTNVPTINTKRKNTFSNWETLLYKEADTGKFYNPTGITNATKPFFNPTIIYANDHNEDYQDFKSSGPLGKLLKLEAKDVLDSDEFEKVQKNFDDLINEQNGIRDHLDNVKHFMERTITSQFDKVALDFDFEIPEMDTIIKKGRVLAEDKNGKQDISEKGTGLQRALTLAVIQAYSTFAKKADAMQFFIDEPELYMHPVAQDNLLNALDKLSEKDNQIFLNTHSPYILRHFNSDKDSVVILSNKPGVDRIRQMKDLVFKPTSIGEITYKAFGVPTVDLHQRLYNVIENKVIYEDNDKNVSSERDFAKYLNNNYEDILTYKEFRARYTNQRSNNNGWIPVKKEPLPYIVRNEIDHPDIYLEDETKTNQYNEKDLKESIEELFQIYSKEFN